jgi:iduronate 2-sulfatase
VIPARAGRRKEGIAPAGRLGWNLRPMRLPRLVCAWLLLACPALADAATAPRPNVLLICVDDLKPVLGCYGDAVVKSPAIDRLAARGTLFERAYCNQAVCSPSRNALMTGLRSTTLGIYDLPTNFRVAAPDAISVAQHFRQHGWRTEALGKIFHTGHGNHEDAASWSVPHWRPKASNYAVPAHNNDPVENADVPDTTYADGQIADEAIRRLQQAKDKPAEPFFLAVGFLKPHLPFCAPKKYWDLYDPRALPLATVTEPPAGAPAYAPTTWGELRKYNDMPAAGPVPADQQRRLIHGYYAAVSYMDAQLGRVTAELERLGLAANTVVVLWGDHGWHLGDHGQWCKHSNYEEAARIPFLVAAPGVSRPGTRTRALVESVDLFPSLAELAGLPAPAGPRSLDGRSFVATLRDPQAPTKQAVFHCFPRNRPGVGNVIGRAVRTARHRLVEWKAPGAAASTAEYELYDYVADPLETQNLAASQPAVVAQLRQILAAQPEAKPQVKTAETSPADTKGRKKKKKA